MFQKLLATIVWGKHSRLFVVEPSLIRCPQTVDSFQAVDVLYIVEFDVVIDWYFWIDTHTHTHAHMQANMCSRIDTRTYIYTYLHDAWKYVQSIIMPVGLHAVFGNLLDCYKRGL